MAKDKKKKCKHCKGTGYISKVEDFVAENWVKGEEESIHIEKEECEVCGGTGYIENDK